MGHDTGTYPDSACETSTGVLHEYPAGCEPYKYRTCSADSNMRWHRAECHILYGYVRKEEKSERTVSKADSMPFMANKLRVDYWIFVVLTNILMHYTISLYDINKRY